MEQNVENYQHFFRGKLLCVALLYPEIIKDSGSIGSFQLGNLGIDIIQMNEYQNDLIKVKS